MATKITLKQAKERLKEARSELYYPADDNGVCKVRPIELKDRIFLFEEIQGLRAFIKKHDERRQF